MARSSSTESSSPRAAVVERLVESAARLFAQSGPDGVSLRRVASEAHVNYGLIHQYIGSKDDLLRLVFRSVSDNAAQRLTDSSDLDKALEELISAKPGPSQYVSMLAWAILQGHDAESLLGRSPALEAMIDRIEEATDSAPDARLRLAFVVSSQLGWMLFGPFAASGVGLEDIEDDEVEIARREILRQILVDIPRITNPTPLTSDIDN